MNKLTGIAISIASVLSIVLVIFFSVNHMFKWSFAEVLYVIFYVLYIFWQPILIIVAIVTNRQSNGVAFESIPMNIVAISFNLLCYLAALGNIVYLSEGASNRFSHF